MKRRSFFSAPASDGAVETTRVFPSYSRLAGGASRSRLLAASVRGEGLAWTLQVVVLEKLLEGEFECAPTVVPASPLGQLPPSHMLPSKLKSFRIPEDRASLASVDTDIAI